jgi:hypothetical protein
VWSLLSSRIGMKHSWQDIPDSVIRLSIVIAVLTVAIASLLHLLPASLTDVDLHQQLTIEREMSREITFAGSGICSDCHVEEPRKKSEGYHFGLSCETCHSPAQEHIADFEIKPTAPRGREFCPTCHAYDPSRPTGFPQINPVAHNPMSACIQCHDPHDPKPPETPRECTACHAEIARTKAVSHHVLLECATCHTVPEQHKLTPRVVRPTKPERREFCGSCHSEDSEVVETPKINLALHEQGYLCWQCHYPHLPELR